MMLSREIGVSQTPQLLGKSTKDLESMQVELELYSDLANQEAVKAEIGDVIEELDEIIRTSLREVLERKGADTLKYEMTGMFATDLNATIKSKVFKKMSEDPIFNSKIKVRKNHSSPFFIVKDKYAVFIKKLTGKMNKPNSYPTKNSKKTFSGKLFVGMHIPFLFVGPNPQKGEGAYVTSLVSRKEVNWTTEAINLFNYQEQDKILHNEKESNISLDNVQVNKEVAKVKRKVKE